MKHTNTGIGRASARGNVRLATLATLLLVGFGTSAAFAGQILYDDFGGPAGPLDGTKWADRVNLVLNGSGQAVNPSGGLHLQAQTSFNFLSTAVTNFGRETFAFGNGGGNMIMGLSGPGLSGTTGNILLRTDDTTATSNTFWEIQVINSGNVGRYFMPINQASPTGIWQIDWYPNRVTASFNGTQQFDSDVNAPQLGTVSSWSSVLPIGVAMHPDFGGTGYNFDFVQWNSEVPEPSAAVLGGLASLFLVVRRKIQRR